MANTYDLQQQYNAAATFKQLVAALDQAKYSINKFQASVSARGWLVAGAIADSTLAGSSSLGPNLMFDSATFVADVSGLNSALNSAWTSLQAEIDRISTKW